MIINHCIPIIYVFIDFVFSLLIVQVLFDELPNLLHYKLLININTFFSCSFPDNLVYLIN